MKRIDSSRYSAIGAIAISAVIGLLQGDVEAVSINTIKDSATFPYLYNGADLANSLGWNVASGTPAGSVVGVTQLHYAGGTDNSLNKGHYGWTDSAMTHSSGYTVEFRFQIIQDSPSFGVFGLLIGDGSSVNDYMILDVDGDAINLDEVAVATGDFTTGFHTLRVAQPANGGDGDTHMWLDNALVANNLTGINVAGLQRMWLGNRTNSFGGEAIIDWIRIDNTGGFAPIPEPTGFVLAATGLVGVLRLGRRRIA